LALGNPVLLTDTEWRSECENWMLCYNATLGCRRAVVELRGLEGTWHPKSLKTGWPHEITRRIQYMIATCQRVTRNKEQYI